MVYQDQMDHKDHEVKQGHQERPERLVTQGLQDPLVLAVSQD